MSVIPAVDRGRGRGFVSLQPASGYTVNLRSSRAAQWDFILKTETKTSKQANKRILPISPLHRAVPPPPELAEMKVSLEILAKQARQTHTSI